MLSDLKGKSSNKNRGGYIIAITRTRKVCYKLPSSTVQLPDYSFFRFEYIIQKKNILFTLNPLDRGSNVKPTFFKDRLLSFSY